MVLIVQDSKVKALKVAAVCMSWWDWYP